MTKVVVISVEGEKGLWVADLGRGTVMPLSVPKAGALAEAAALAARGSVITKGVNLAVAVKSADSVAAGHYDG